VANKREQITDKDMIAEKRTRYQKEKNPEKNFMVHSPYHQVIS